MRELPFVIVTHPFLAQASQDLFRGKARVKRVRNRSELLREISRADGLVARLLDSIDEELLSRAPKLKVVGNFAVGYENIDLPACRRRGIRVVNTPDVLTRATAELTTALLLAAARRIPEGEALCRKGKFRGWEPDLLLGLTLQGRKAVLVGRGRIGRETAKLFRALGLAIEWITRADSETQIRAKLKRAEILSLHVPLNPGTRHWLNAKRLELLPRDAIVLNTTRGPVIEEKALIRALRQKRIFAAGLDVFEREPFIPSALRALPNVVLLPHLGSATRQARIGMARLAVGGTIDLLLGKAPPNEVKF